MDLLVEKDRNKPNFGDTIFVNGSCPTTANFVDAVAQRVFIMLRTFQGEWYLNSTTGVPYLQSILGFKVSKTVVDRIIQEKVLGEEGVAAIEAFSSTLEGTRVYTASLTIRTTQGTTFTETVNIQ